MGVDPVGALGSLLIAGAPWEGEKLVGALTKALTLPGRALTDPGSFGSNVSLNGQPSDADRALMDEATNFASIVPMGQLALPKPSGSLGIFGGRMAQTANMPKLAEAQALDKNLMEKFPAKRDRQAMIYSQTGWFQGGDQKWRFEIPDSEAQLDLSAIPKDGGAPLDTVLHHPKLFSAYPNLRDAEVKGVESKDFLGSYDPYGKTETINMAQDIGSATHNPLSIMLHEVQHGIQNREGFANGAAPGEPDINAAYDKVMANAADVTRQVNEGFEEWAKEHVIGSQFMDSNQRTQMFHKYLQTIPSLATRYRQSQLIQNRRQVQGPDLAAYMHVAGEVEARNVENRFGRSNTIMPWLTEDTPTWAQIVRFMK